DLFHGQSIPLFPMMFAIYCYTVLARKRSGGGVEGGLGGTSLFLVFLASNPPWALWGLPLLPVVLLTPDQLSLALPFTLGFFGYATLLAWQLFQWDVTSTYLTYLAPLRQRLDRHHAGAMLEALGFGALVFGLGAALVRTWRQPVVGAAVDAD